MITFNKIGHYGRFGNQMFQYASLKGIASNNGHDWCIPDQQYFGNHYDLLSHIYQCFNIKCNTGFVDGPTIEEKFAPDEIKH